MVTMSSQPKVSVLIINGDGINADNELKFAFETNGAVVSKVKVNDLLENPSMIHQFHIIGFPGGFSFGDEIRSGKVLAMKMEGKLRAELLRFIDDKKLIIGICNGFQILVQLNLFDRHLEFKNYTLTTNDHGEFRNFWTEVNTIISHSEKSPWLKGMASSFYLPVRHKEGRLILSHQMGENELLPVLRYKEAINGSTEQIAGITDKTGRVFGLMPHPEAAIFQELCPEGISHHNAENVRNIFKNAINYCNENLMNSL